MNWKDKLKSITDFASNIDLYNTEKIRKGELQELVVCLSDIIPFIESLLKEQREICADIRFDDLTMDGKEYILLGDRERIRDKIRNAPEPTGDK